MNAQLRRAFLDDYRTIRRAEGRGSPDSAYYCSLPDRDLTGRNQQQWDIRARTYRYFVRTILRQFEQRRQSPLDILDLGAGNCWMSHRLCASGHRAIALDLFRDLDDGLLARRHYPVPIPAVEATFDDLPFAQRRFDLIIFNSSFHYSSDYTRTLAEARRCLRPDGAAVIMDTPLYERFEHGEQMRVDKYRSFQQRYGFRSDRLPSIDFLDRSMLAKLAVDIGVHWEELRPWYGWQWFLRPYRAMLARKRPPSQFGILVARFEGS